MKVKIEDSIYDANDTPILLILNEDDKKNLLNMDESATKYCSYPKEYNSDYLIDFMKNVDLDQYQKPIETIITKEKTFSKIEKLIDFDIKNLKEFLSYHQYWKGLGICNYIEKVSDNEYKIIDDDLNDGSVYKYYQDDNIPYYLVESNRKYLDDFFYGNILIPLKEGKYWKVEYSIE